MSDLGSGDPRVVLDADQISRACARMAHQILEANRGAAGLVLLGIPTRGVILATRLADAMEAVEGGDDTHRIPRRDDVSRRPAPPAHPRGRTHAGADPGRRRGRGAGRRRACSPAGPYGPRSTPSGDLGRPRAVRLAVLVDRGHRQLPIRADHVGKNLPTAAGERVRVRLAEVDGVNEVTISPQESTDDLGGAA